MIVAPVYTTDIGRKYPFLPISVVSDFSEEELIENLPDQVLSAYQIITNKKIGYCPVDGLIPRKIVIEFLGDKQAELTFPSPFSSLDFVSLQDYPTIKKVKTVGEVIRNRKFKYGNLL